MKKFIGIDIGGTKCAATLGESEAENIKIAAKERFETPVRNPQETIKKLFEATDAILKEKNLSAADIAAFGISCGGPLDSKRGIIQNPPNLPAWDNIKICDAFSERYGVPCGLQNDANACALAEWKFGAGRGFDDIAFLTFGTGLGAGLILDGRLYCGANDNAGEVGHIRLGRFGPVGYGKRGSFEGFCSGAGIAKIAKDKVLEQLQMGKHPTLCPDADKLDSLNAKTVADAADAGDKLALEIYAESGRMLGFGLSVIIDILNPQRIIIGGIFTRSRNLLWRHALEVLEREALPSALSACEVVPAELGEFIGDYAALSVAKYESDKTI